jgi:hypothetical protein
MAIKPTGWTFSSSSNNGIIFHPHIRKDAHGQPVKRKDTITILSLPYSEHSSFSELIEFLNSPWLDFDWIIPTVDNRLDLYLCQKEFKSAEALLLAWHRYQTQSKES